MKPLPAVVVAVLLPLITAPWWFVGGGGGFWLGVPAWVIVCLAATVVLAVAIAACGGRWWDSLAEEADAAAEEADSPGARDEGP